MNVHPTMKVQLVNSNKTTIVSTEDYVRVSMYEWRLSKKGKAKPYIVMVGSSISLHRFILNVEDSSIDVDHKDHNTLNNTRTNLRKATRSQNLANKLPQDGYSEFKGVGLNASGNYTASITVRYKPIYLGSFKKEKLAALAYDKAALFYFGSFSLRNFSDEVLTKYGDRVPIIDYRKKWNNSLSNSSNKEFRALTKKEKSSLKSKELKSLITTNKSKTYIKVKLQGSMAGDKTFITDYKFYKEISSHKWNLDDDLVIYRCANKKKIRLLSIINETGLDTYYKDGNRFNLRLSNLEFVTNTVKKHKLGLVKNPDKGIKLLNNKYRVSTYFNNREINLGVFKSKTLALISRDKALYSLSKGLVGKDSVLPVKNINVCIFPIFKSNKYQGVRTVNNKHTVWIDSLLIGKFKDINLALQVYDYACSLLIVHNDWLNNVEIRLSTKLKKKVLLTVNLNN